MEFDIQVRPEGVVIFEMHGAVQGGESAQNFLESVRAVLAASRLRLIIDLEDVPFINSSGYGVMIYAYTKVREAGGQMVFAGPRDRVRSVMRILRLDEVMIPYDSREEAEQALIELDLAGEAAE